jgi:hypothetical protein
MNGISKGSKFEIYQGVVPRNREGAICRLAVHEVRPGGTVLANLSPNVELPLGDLYALQLQSDTDVVYVSVDGSHKDDLKSCCQRVAHDMNGENHLVRIECHPTKADILLSCEAGQVTLRHLWLREYLESLDISQLPSSSFAYGDTLESQLGDVLRKATHAHQILRCTSVETGPGPLATLELKLLKEMPESKRKSGGRHTDPRPGCPMYEPDGDSHELVSASGFTVTGHSDRIYGIKIINNTSQILHPYLYYFNPWTLAIRESSLRFAFDPSNNSVSAQMRVTSQKKLAMVT